MTLRDVTLEAGAELEIRIPAGQRAFFMPINGLAEIDGKSFGLQNLGAAILPFAQEGTTHRLLVLAGGTKVTVLIGEPLHQPVISNGPMAFATQEGLLAATAAYQRGELGRL